MCLRNPIERPAGPYRQECRSAPSTNEVRHHFRHLKDGSATRTAQYRGDLGSCFELGGQSDDELGSRFGHAVLMQSCRAPCRTVSSHVCSPNRGAFESLRPTSNTNNAKPINIWSCLGHGLWPNFAQAKFIRISKTKLSGRLKSS